MLMLARAHSVAVWGPQGPYARGWVLSGSSLQRALEHRLRFVLRAPPWMVGEFSLGQGWASA